MLSEASKSPEKQCENCYALNVVKWLLLVKRADLSNQRCVADRQYCIALNNVAFMLLRSHLLFSGAHGLMVDGAWLHCEGLS